MWGPLVKEFSNMKINSYLKNEKLLLGILLIGFLVRIAYIGIQKDEIYWIDGVEYHSLAQQLVNGNGYVAEDNTPTAYRPIGYPLFLALVFKLGSSGLLWIRFIQCIFSCATILLVYILAKRMLGMFEAIISAGIVAIYPYFIFIPGAILPTCWFSFLLVLGVILLFRNKEKNNIFNLVIAGLIFGLATLTRPSAAVLVLMVISWLFIINIKKSKVAMINILAFSVCVSLVVLPWVYRNYTTLGKPTVATNGGRNFWLGNNPNATATSGNNIALTNALETQLDATQTEIEREHIYYQAGKQFISQNPDVFIRSSIKKVINFWRLYPIPTSGYPQIESTSRLVGTLASAFLFVLGVLGLIMVWKSTKPETFLLILFIIAFTVLHALYISKVRMRLPLDHFLVIFASYSVARSIICIRNIVLNIRLFKVTKLKLGISYYFKILLFNIDIKKIVNRID